MGTEVTFTITVYSEQTDVNPNNLVNLAAIQATIDGFLPDLLDAADLGMLDWDMDIHVQPWTDEV